MPDDEPRLDEQALAQIAEVGISSQLDTAEKLEVDIRTDLARISQGKVDFVSIIGEGLVVRPDIRVRELELQARNVAVDWLRAVFGNIKLEQPAPVALRIVLDEADLNRAINSDFVRNKIPFIPLKLEGRLFKLQLKQIALQLGPEDRLVCHGDILLQEREKLQQIRFTAAARSRTDDYPIRIEGFSCKDGDVISLELAYAFIKTARELANAPELEFEGIKFKIEKMEIREGSIMLHIEARVSQIPSL
ncbi:MAG: DUF2993 domain-containing protein [Cyanobacteriota bacterium]|nr:DUF2993 domain-containing protein [Cyanobacteriota bacterium]